jgi:hypothetical protein
MSRVAPFQSCVVCLRGDVTTMIVLRGQAEWAIAGLMRLGIPRDQAMGTVEKFAETELGCRPGKVPDGTFDYAARVCRECAEKAGCRVG